MLSGPKRASSHHRRFLTLILKSALSLVGKGSSQVNSVVTLLLIGYWRDAAAAGSYSLGVKYTSLALGLTTMGLDALLIRDIAQDARRSQNYLRHLSLLRLATGCLGYGAVALFVHFIPSYTAHTVRVVLLLALGLVPEGLYRLYQSALIALDAYAALAWVGGIRAVLGLTAGVGALWSGASLEVLVLLQVAVSAFSLLMILLPLAAQVRRVRSLHEMEGCGRLSWGRAGQWLREASSFAVIDGLFALDGQIDLLLLSFFLGETDVGYYGIAQGIVAIPMLLLYAVDTVVYPLLSRSVVRTRRTGQIYRRLMVGILVGVVPLALLTGIGARVVVPHSFGQFVPILPPLYWLIASWAVHFINVPSARVIIALGRQSHVAIFMTVGVATTAFLSLVTTPSLGTQGPAMARTISATVYALLCTIAALVLLARVRGRKDGTAGNNPKELLPSGLE